MIFLEHMVKSIPLIDSVGLRFSLILSIVFTNWVIPSRAKNSVWSGTNNSSEATKDIIVKRLKDGGQSINTLSYFWSVLCFSPVNISFKTNALLASVVPVEKSELPIELPENIDLNSQVVHSYC